MVEYVRSVAADGGGAAAEIDRAKKLLDDGTITQAEYGVYGLQAVAVVGTFCVGILLVPSLTTSIFTGHGGQTVITSIPRLTRLR